MTAPVNWSYFHSQSNTNPETPARSFDMKMDADLGQDIWDDLSWSQAVCADGLANFLTQNQPVPARVGCGGPEAVQEASYISKEAMASEIVCNRCCEPELSLFCPKSELSDNSTVILQNASEVMPVTRPIVPYLPQPMYSILTWLRAISSHPVCLVDECDEDGNLIQEKSDTSSNAFLHVDYSDGIMPGLARFKNCDLPSNINEPCPKSLYEYYTSLEGQCLAVELISLILVCLIFHCLYINNIFDMSILAHFIDNSPLIDHQAVYLKLNAVLMNHLKNHHPHLINPSLTNEMNLKCLHEGKTIHCSKRHACDHFIHIQVDDWVVFVAIRECRSTIFKFSFTCK